MITECFYDDTLIGGCAQPMAAVSWESWLERPLCPLHLNMVLDYCDAGVSDEPDSLRFFDPPMNGPRVRWTWWSHDPEPLGTGRAGEIKLDLEVT